MDPKAGLPSSPSAQRGGPSHQGGPVVSFKRALTGSARSRQTAPSPSIDDLAFAAMPTEEVAALLASDKGAGPPRRVIDCQAAYSNSAIRAAHATAKRCLNRIGAQVGSSHLLSRVTFDREATECRIAPSCLSELLYILKANKLPILPNFSPTDIAPSRDGGDFQKKLAGLQIMRSSHRRQVSSMRKGSAPKKLIHLRQRLAPNASTRIKRLEAALEAQSARMGQVDPVATGNILTRDCPEETEDSHKGKPRSPPGASDGPPSRSSPCSLRALEMQSTGPPPLKKPARAPIAPTAPGAIAPSDTQEGPTKPQTTLTRTGLHSTRLKSLPNSFRGNPGTVKVSALSQGGANKSASIRDNAATGASNESAVISETARSSTSDATNKEKSDEKQ